MRLKEMSITISRTFNLGNFESLRIEAGCSASVDPEIGDTTEEMRDKILIEVRRSLATAYKDQVSKK